MRDLESVLDIRSGALTSMFADAANILRGLGDILYTVTSKASTASELPTSIDPTSVPNLAMLVAQVRAIAARLNWGLPDDVIWMGSLEDEVGVVLDRAQTMALRAANFRSPDNLLDTGRFPQLMTALGAPSASTTTFAQRLQQSVRSWRLAGRQRLLESQLKRLPPECRPQLQFFFRATGTDFERALEAALECLGVKIAARDDGTRPSFPDLVTNTPPVGDLAIECKSKTVGDSVNFNDATDVIRKASVNGLGKAFKLTVCQPYLNPDVARKLVQCDELCVVNAEDLAEALVRVKLGKLSIDALADWIRRPGQAVREQIPIQAPLLKI